MAQENPVISIKMRQLLRDNIADCRNPHMKSSLPVLEERYGDHVEMLLAEVERLETGHVRLAEEYIREKWQMTDEITRLKATLFKRMMMEDIFGTPKTVQDHSPRAQKPKNSKP